MPPLSQLFNTTLRRTWAKPVVFAIFLLPFLWLIYRAFWGDLGANPSETLVRKTGDYALRTLCITLAITPLRQIFNLTQLARFRRMVGLFAYFYAFLHLLCYAWFDKEFIVVDIAKDILKRPFIWVGFVTFVMLTFLAATSFKRAIQWLGAKRWLILHKMVYIASLLAILHFYWMRSAKNNTSEVFVYGFIVALLLVFRFFHYQKSLSWNPSSDSNKKR